MRKKSTATRWRLNFKKQQLGLWFAFIYNLKMLQQFVFVKRTQAKNRKQLLISFISTSACTLHQSIAQCQASTEVKICSIPAMHVLQVLFICPYSKVFPGGRSDFSYSMKAEDKGCLGSETAKVCVPCSNTVGSGSKILLPYFHMLLPKAFYKGGKL